LFRQGPCEKRDELFDREEELGRTIEALRKQRMGCYTWNEDVREDELSESSCEYSE
jgi:hypothetical protein